MDGGRATACAAVRRSISDDDRRVLRGRALRAHLAGCAPCAGFAGQIRRRRQDLRILVPAGPALALTLLAGGGAAGGSAAGGGLALGFGASSAIKCVAACASAAVVGVGGVSALSSGPEPGRAGTERPRAAVTAAATSEAERAASRRQSARTVRPRAGAGAQGASRTAVAVMLAGAGTRRLPDHSRATRPTFAETESTRADEVPAATAPKSSASAGPDSGTSDPRAPSAGAPGAQAPGTGDVEPAATAPAAGPSPTTGRTAYSPAVALALADARAEVDAALAAARQATEQALAGATPTRTQAAPSVFDAFTLLDAVLRRG
jgi:hypothetical protein